MNLTGAEGGPRVAVIIPTVNEERTLPHLLKDLSGLKVPAEILVADGSSDDRTRGIAEEFGARVVPCERGRGVQLRTGAEAASAPLLVFLHADVRLPAESIAEIDRLATAHPARALAFRFRIDSARPIFRVLERGTHLRATIGLPYGDQGLIIPAELYWRAGGHPPIPIMEDVSLNRALWKHGRIGILSQELLISSRRWDRDGPLRRTFLNLSLALRFLAGVSPEALSAHYRTESDHV